MEIFRSVPRTKEEFVLVPLEIEKATAELDYFVPRDPARGCKVQKQETLHNNIRA